MAATVGQLLRDATGRLRAAGSPSSRLDAELLLGHVLGVDRTSVLAHPDAPVGDGQVARFETLVVRRSAGEPVAYLRGIKEFLGLAFAVDARALIPRPETEQLVEIAVDWIGERLISAPRPLDAPPIGAWDVGTGCGAIAIATAVSLRTRGFLDHVRLIASDRSPDALRVAVENAVAHGVADRITFAEGDLLALDPRPDRVEVLIANLPYVRSAEVRALGSAAYEPALALDGGPDGLDVIRRLVDGLGRAMAPEGVCLLEIGADQAAAVLELVSGALPGWPAVVRDDLAGRPRVLVLDAPAALA